jgi:hypothetical protein
MSVRVESGRTVVTYPCGRQLDPVHGADWLRPGKVNRVTEMIMATLIPTTPMIGKILAILATGAVQMLTFVLPVAASYFVIRNSLGIPEISLAALVPEPSAMIFGALLLLGGFILFAGTLVATPAARSCRSSPTSRSPHR